MKVEGESLFLLAVRKEERDPGVLGDEEMIKVRTSWLPFRAVVVWARADVLCGAEQAMISDTTVPMKP